MKRLSIIAENFRKRTLINKSYQMLKNIKVLKI